LKIVLVRAAGSALQTQPLAAEFSTGSGGAAQFSSDAGGAAEFSSGTGWPSPPGILTLIW
jgi:hypothetical protein